MLSALVLALVPQGYEREPADPADYSSPYGEHDLRVEPRAPSGEGPAHYRLTRAKELVWEGELPFSLREAAVTTDGRVVGYALGRGELIVAVVAPDGRVVLDHRVERNLDNSRHGPGHPNPLGLVVYGEHDRFLLWVSLGFVQGGGPRWWQFRISTGERLDDLRPEALLEQEEGSLGARDVRSVPGTGLYLFHCSNSSTHGTTFSLMDYGKVVWRLDLPGERAAILETRRGGRFVLSFAEAGERVEFTARSDASADNGWIVSEVARAPYPPESEAALETRQLRQIASVPLQLGNSDLSSALEAGGRAILPGGRVCILDRRTGALHVWDENGSLLLVGDPAGVDPDVLLRITAGANNSIWVQRGLTHQYLGWNAEGERLDPQHWGGDVAFTPDRETLWVWERRGGLRHLDYEGLKVSEIDYRPDGRWIRSVGDVAFDDQGGLIVSDTLGPRLRPKDLGVDLLLYSSAGEPMTIIRVPECGPSAELRWSPGWVLVTSLRASETGSAFLVDPVSGHSLRITATEERVGRKTFGFSADGTALLCLKVPELELLRCELPPTGK